MAKRLKKNKVLPVDGLGPKDAERLVRAIRQVWSWNYARKLCIERATDKNGFGICEKCKKKVPKLFADHIKPIGKFDPRTYIERSFRPSSELQALCKKCHGKKTYEENKQRKIDQELDTWK